MSNQQKKTIARPHRSDVPSHGSPGCGKERPFPATTSSNGHKLHQPEQEEEASNSQDTMKTFTPPGLSCLQDINEVHFTKDATTPVVGGISPLPSPPQSPPSRNIPHSPRTDFTSAFTENVSEDHEAKQEGVDSPSHNSRMGRRANSQRYADKNRRAQAKKNKGVVIGDFNGLYGDELSLKVGEEIEIISKDTVVSRNIGWWTGRNGKGKIGIFPAACVLCDIVGTEKGAAGGKEYPLEIKNSEIEMKEVIGIGGFGKVYRGTYKGEEVAVKVAKTTTYDSLKAVQDVIAEAEKFAHLAHINICALVGVVLVKDVCLVMECCQGGALSEVLHKGNQSIPVDVIIDWASQIASGMHYLHHEADPSLIHRDLKTSNILLAHSTDTVDMRSNVIKITDFGLAREIEHTTHMSGAGTYPWMAPEIIRTSNFSKKSDVWSFAVVLWEMVTGERPYNGLSFFVVAYGVGHGTLTLPIPDGCPELLSKLMKECWARDYTKRPSFVQIVADIKAMMRSDFCHSTSEEEFRSLQTLWKEEIQKKFVELKKMELELERREIALQREIQEQEKRKKELEEEKKEMRKKKEEYEILIRQLSLQQESSSGARDGDEDVVDGHPRRSSASAAESLLSPQPKPSRNNTMPLASRESPPTRRHQPTIQQQQQSAQSPEQPRTHQAYPTPHIQPPLSPSFLQHQQEHQRQRLHGISGSSQLHQQYHPYPHQPTLQRGDRPPRLKPFSLKKLIRKLWGTDPSAKDRSIDNPLPDRMETIRTIRRITSSPAPSTERRARSRSGGDRDGNPAPPARSGSLRSKKEDQFFLLPGKAAPRDQQQNVVVKSHKRRSSDSMRGVHLEVEPSESTVRRGSVPSSPSHKRHQIHETIITAHNKSHTPQLGSKTNPQEARTRQRSLSDLRSPSPQFNILPSYYSVAKTSNTSTPPLPSTSVHPSLFPSHAASPSPHSTSPHPPLTSTSPFAPPLKPSHLNLLNPNKTSRDRKGGGDSNSPGSPNVMITPAEQHPLRHVGYQYDSGKDSMTCSDASGHSNSSEKPMIELDSPVHFPIAATRSRLSGCIDYIAAEFDPLKQSTSQDSLLDSTNQDRVLTTSPTLTPTFHHHHQQLQQRQLQLQQQQLPHLGKSAEVLTETNNVLWSIGSTTQPMSVTSKQSLRSSGSTSTSPKKADSTSPKQSMNVSASSISSNASARSTSDLTASGSYQYPSTPSSSSIARPRPKPSKDINLQTISAPSSRPHSPKTETKQKWDFKRNRFSMSSPTGSVKSMQDLPYDSDCGDYYLDSNSSSLINLGVEGEHETMVLDGFDFFNCFLSQN